MDRPRDERSPLLDPRPQSSPDVSTSYKWFLVGITCVQMLTIAGIVDGFSGLSLAMQRDGVYSERCLSGSGGDSSNSSIPFLEDETVHAGDTAECSAALLKLHNIFFVGACSVGLSLIILGFVMDSIGPKLVRLAGLIIFSIGACLFAFSDSRTFDVYAPAMGLIGVGGGAVRISAFVIAEHFEGSFGTVHTLLNAACNCATVTFLIFDYLHLGGISIRALFISLAIIGLLFAALNNDYVWCGLMQRPEEIKTVETSASPEDGSGKNSGRAEEAGSGHGKEARDGAVVATGDEDNSLANAPFTEQLMSLEFMLTCFWMLIDVLRCLWILGTIRAQIKHGGGGRDGDSADDLVRVFNWLILAATVGSALAFGMFLDRYGIALGFIAVNVSGLIAFQLLSSSSDALLYVAFVAFGCYRVWNFTMVSSFCQTQFGGANFGKIYGLVNAFGFFAALIEAQILKLSLEHLEEWGGFGPVNMALQVLSVMAFALPIYIMRKSNLKAN